MDAVSLDESYFFALLQFNKIPFDFTWLAFDPLCSSLVYGIALNEKKNEISLVKCNLRVALVTTVKTLSLTPSKTTAKINLSNAIAHLKFEISEWCAVYFTSISTDDVYYPNIVFINFNTSFWKLYKFAENNCSNNRKSLLTYKVSEKPTLIGYKIDQSSSQGWFLGIFGNMNGVRVFEFYKIRLDRVDYTFNCEPVFKDGEISEPPVNYFLNDNSLYFTYFNVNFIRVFDMSKNQWLQNIVIPPALKLCRRIESTKNGLIFMFNGRKPFFRLKQKKIEKNADVVENAAYSWKQLPVEIPNHESFVGFVMDYDENLLISIPRAQTMDIFYGRLNDANQCYAPISLRTLAFKQYLQKFPVPEQKEESKFVPNLGLPNQLLRAYFGPLWTLKVADVENVLI